MKTKTRRETARPVSQKSHAEIDKNQNIVLQSIKEYSNGKRRTDVQKLSLKSALVKKLKDKRQTPTASAFKKLAYPIAHGLNITSKAVKANLANHARECSHAFRPMMRLLGRQDLLSQVTYGKKTSENVKATSKRKAKKTRKTKKTKKSSK